MGEKRSEGLTVVALEQTSTSTLLNKTARLPERMVVLLGNEQQGLPSWLLLSGLVDQFVELPLLGKTQSLNVHVAASMLLWHHQLQHGKHMEEHGIEQHHQEICD